MDVTEYILTVISKESLEEKLWYLVGALGDGSLYMDGDKYVIEYGQKDVLWLEIAIKMRIEALGYKPYLVKHKGGKYHKLKVYSKALYQILKSLNNNDIANISINHFVSYLRGFFDAEGTITKQDSKRIYARISQKNRELLYKISLRLRSELGINATDPFINDKAGVYVIQIPNYHLDRFISIIKPCHPSKITKYIALRNIPLTSFLSST